MLRNMKELHGFTIGATDGDIGSVKEFYFDDVSYTVRYVVVDTGGWLSNRKVLLSPIAFRGMDWAHKRITSALTKDKVEKSPDIDTDKPVSRQHETSTSTTTATARTGRAPTSGARRPIPISGPGRS